MLVRYVGVWKHKFEKYFCQIKLQTITGTGRKLMCIIKALFNAVYAVISDTHVSLPFPPRSMFEFIKHVHYCTHFHKQPLHVIWAQHFSELQTILFNQIPVG